MAKPARRRFTAEDKRRILQEADRCREPGDVAALLRREGLYSRTSPRGGRPGAAGSWRGWPPRPEGRSRRGPIPGTGRSPRWSGSSPGPRRAPSGPRHSSTSKKQSRPCWASRCPSPKGRGDGHGTGPGLSARRGPDLRGAGSAPGHVLPAAAPSPPSRPAPVATSRAGAPGTSGSARPAARAALRGSRAGRGLRRAPGRGAVPLLRADDVPNPGGPPGGPRAAEPAAASPLRGPRAAGHPPHPALELGQHHAPRAGDLDVLLPVCTSFSMSSAATSSAGWSRIAKPPSWPSASSPRPARGRALRQWRSRSTPTGAPP